MGNASGHWNGQGFFGQDPQSTRNESLNRKHEHITLKCFRTVKEAISRVGDSLQMGENIWDMYFWDI